jgi:GntR family transcriptional regulator
MSPRQPAHRRIERYLRDLIASGAGRTEALPSEVELTERFGVSRMTVRQAFNSLVAAGLVVRYRSKGTFAATRVLEDVGALTSEDFLDRWAAQGHTIELRVLAYEARPAPQSVAEQFDVEVGAPLTYMERLRLVDSLPLAWDVRWLTREVLDLVPAADFENRSVFTALTERGIEIAEMGFEIRAHPARAVDARHLSCRRGATVLRRELVCTAPGGAAVISGSSVYPAGHVSYRARLTFNGSSYPTTHL